MTTEQKFAAIQSLTGHHGTSLKMRSPGDWYVSATGREVKEGGMLRGAYGNGATPDAAIEDDWNKITAPGTVVVLNAMDPNKRREVSWNGFMWEDVLS